MVGSRKNSCDREKGDPISRTDLILIEWMRIGAEARLEKSRVIVWGATDPSVEVSIPRLPDAVVKSRTPKLVEISTEISSAAPIDVKRPAVSPSSVSMS